MVKTNGVKQMKKMYALVWIMKGQNKWLGYVSCDNYEHLLERQKNHFEINGEKFDYFISEIY